MKILVVSDTHMFNDIFKEITERYKNHTDLLIHCGDSSLRKNDLLLKDYHIVVRGNHDNEDFPYIVYKDNILITHGHKEHVYEGYDNMLKKAGQHHCNICFHGHTHVASHTIIDNIHFINPGSTMMNRGSYGFGTYAIVDIKNNQITVTYYHHTQHYPVNEIVLPDGIKMLKEFKELVKVYNKRM